MVNHNDALRKPRGGPPTPSTEAGGRFIQEIIESLDISEPDHIGQLQWAVVDIEDSARNAVLDEIEQRLAPIEMGERQKYVIARIIAEVRAKDG